MKIGEIWLNRDKELGCTISSFDQDRIAVRFCDAAQMATQIPRDTFLRDWEKAPDFSATRVSWNTDEGRDYAACATILHASAGTRSYVVYVSDEAVEDLKLPRCKSIAERKIVAAPWAKRIDVISTDR